MKMSNIDELKRLVDKLGYNKDPVEIEKTKLEIEALRQRKIQHESDKNIGRIVAQLKIKIARDNLFMDDITREELK